MRLIKLMRLIKASRLLKRWQTHLALDFSTQTILTALCSYLLAGHWYAARSRTPPHAPECRAPTKLVLLAFTAIAPDGTSGACSS